MANSFSFIFYKSFILVSQCYLQSEIHFVVSFLPLCCVMLCFSFYCPRFFHFIFFLNLYIGEMLSIFSVFASLLPAYISQIFSISSMLSCLALNSLFKFKPSRVTFFNLFFLLLLRSGMSSFNILKLFLNLMYL